MPPNDATSKPQGKSDNAKNSSKCSNIKEGEWKNRHEFMLYCGLDPGDPADKALGSGFYEKYGKPALEKTPSAAKSSSSSASGAYHREPRGVLEMGYAECQGPERASDFSQSSSSYAPSSSGYGSTGSNTPTTTNSSSPSTVSGGGRSQGESGYDTDFTQSSYDTDVSQSEGSSSGGGYYEDKGYSRGGGYYYDNGYSRGGGYFYEEGHSRRGR